MYKPPFLKEGYLGLLTPDVREEFWHRMYYDCDGLTITTRSQWLSFQRGRETIYIITDENLTKRGLDNFIEDFAKYGRAGCLSLSAQFTMTYNPSYRPDSVTIRSMPMIYVAPLCHQLIEALRQLAH